MRARISGYYSLYIPFTIVHQTHIERDKMAPVYGEKVLALTIYVPIYMLYFNGESYLTYFSLLYI